MRRLSLIILLGILGGCGSSGPTEQVLAAQRHFQRLEVQEALDVLDADDSTEGHYLKALALHYLKSPEAAQAELGVALQADPENVKYRSFQLRMELPQGKVATADELIRIHEEHPTSAAAALFAFWAHGAKRIYYLAKDKPDAARPHADRGVAALKTSISLSAQVPELQREMFELAEEFRLGKEVDALVKKLRQVAPEDPDLIIASTPEMAVAEAAQFYSEENASEHAGMVYATALTRAGATAANDRAFKEIYEAHGKNAAVVSLYAAYLGKSGRLSEATKILDNAVATEDQPGARRHLMRISIYLALERGEADMAEARLNRYRKELSDPLLANYFEGRILFLRNDHRGAVRKLRKVVEAEKSVTGSSRQLAAEALQWIGRILADRVAVQRLGGASQAVSPADDPASGSDAASETSPNAAAEPTSKPPAE